MDERHWETKRVEARLTRATAPLPARRPHSRKEDRQAGWARLILWAGIGIGSLILWIAPLI